MTGVDSPDDGNALHVTCEIHPDVGITVLRLNTPQRRNALSDGIRRMLSAALGEAAADQNRRVTVLTATNEVFSAGFDLDEFDHLSATTIWSSADDLHRSLLEHPIPIVAAVNGPAYGGGFDLVTLADVRIGSSNARFAHPERLRYPVMYSPLARIVGEGRATEIVLTGRTIDAHEALQIGLLNQMVGPDELLDHAMAVARQIAETPRELLTAMRRKIMRHGMTDLPTLDL